jgi:hypothetical protein
VLPVNHRHDTTIHSIFHVMRGPVNLIAIP